MHEYLLILAGGVVVIGYNPTQSFLQNIKNFIIFGILMAAFLSTILPIHEMIVDGIF